MNPTYLATARLLTEIAPVVFESGVFALKGGTAINLFLREMPRLSVDLDLVFTDHRLPRAEALAAINEALRVARDRLAKRGFRVQAVSAADMGETKLLVRTRRPLREDRSQHRDSRHRASDADDGADRRGQRRADGRPGASRCFRRKTSTAASWSPRWTASIRAICSTSWSSSRTAASRRRSDAPSSCTSQATTARFHEVLFPTPKDIRLAYEGSFVGMTTEPVTLEALLETRERLFRELPAALDANEREFLRTLVRAEPRLVAAGNSASRGAARDSMETPESGAVGAQRTQQDFAHYPTRWTSVWSDRRDDLPWSASACPFTRAHRRGTPGGSTTGRDDQSVRLSRLVCGRCCERCETSSCLYTCGSSPEQRVEAASGSLVAMRGRCSWMWKKQLLSNSRDFVRY